MSLGPRLQVLRTRLRALLRNTRGNVAMIFALSLIPITIAAGAGIDLGRAMIVRSRLAEALDAAGLAVGATQGLTTTQMTTLAQQYFSANYTADSSFGTPEPVTLATATDANGNTDGVTLSTSVQMPTTLMNVVGIKTMPVGYSSQVTWGQTKLWVSLVLDNTGSMTETDNTGTSKISALKTATQQLLTTLKGVAENPGDVEVALIPFSKDVNLGSSYENASWIDWTDWEAPPANGTVSSSVGPGSSCPYSTRNQGFSCQSNPTNGSSTTNTIPSSGSYAGYICPSVDSGSVNSGRMGRYYNGCYNSVGTTTTGTIWSCTGSSNSCTCNGRSSCTCASSGRNQQTCTQTGPVTGAPYTHTWIVNNHSTWDGCVMDRTQNYDVSNTTPSGTSSDFPAENAQSCPPGTVSPLSYDWTALSDAVNAMTAQGSTNQPIGLAWGWQMMTQGDPMDAPALPADTSQVIIILSDGLNTQDRWYGDGSNESTQVDGRMNTLCASAKAAGITVYAVFVDLNGTQGNSSVLQNCATDANHYFDLTTSGSIITTFNQIATQITQLRVAK
jgi:Flp pilus assembly protein TadG